MNALCRSLILFSRSGPEEELFTLENVTTSTEHNGHALKVTIRGCCWLEEL